MIAVFITFIVLFWFQNDIVRFVNEPDWKYKTIRYAGEVVYVKTHRNLFSVIVKYFLYFSINIGTISLFFRILYWFIAELNKTFG